MADTMAALVERNRAHLAAYAAADFGANAFANEQAFLATADTEAGDTLCSDPPAIRDHADLMAALAYVVEDRDFIQAPHERILRLAIAYLEQRG
jgi:hypothetical protein